MYNLLIYQTRESSLVPAGFLAVHFLQKLYIYEAFLVMGELGWGWGAGAWAGFEQGKIPKWTGQTGLSFVDFLDQDLPAKIYLSRPVERKSPGISCPCKVQLTKELSWGRCSSAQVQWEQFRAILPPCHLTGRLSGVRTGWRNLLECIATLLKKCVLYGRNH